MSTPKEIIDPPVGPYSPAEEIRAWVDELKNLGDSPEVKLAIDEAEQWLDAK